MRIRESSSVGHHSEKERHESPPHTHDSQFREAEVRDFVVVCGLQEVERRSWMDYTRKMSG
jgi:hypothetical protein